MIVLDTHALIWWAGGDDRISSTAKSTIESELQSDNGLVLVSTISAWEIALLVQRDKLTLSMEVDEWLEEVGAIEGVRFVPVDNDIAVASTRLPGEFHKDPADRMIVALARHLNAGLVTSDDKIRMYRHVRTIW